MVNDEILRIEITNFITHVLLSKKRRARYYKKGKKIPKKYQTNEYGYNKQEELIHKATKMRVIANPRSVGTPRLKKINGQDIYRGNNNPYIRSKMVSEMKAFFADAIVKSGIDPIDSKHYPIEMELEMHIPLNAEFDVDNAGWLYVKVIQDVLTQTGTIVNDVAVLLPKTGGVQFVPIETGQANKMVIILRENNTPFRNKLKQFVKTEELTF